MRPIVVIISFVFWFAVSGNPLYGDSFSPGKIEQQLQSISEKCIEATVTLDSKKMSGTAVVISGDGFLLTTGHLWRSHKKETPLTIIFNNGKKVKAKCLGFNREEDIALAKITTFSNEPWPHVELAVKAPPVKTLCFLLGHPQKSGKTRRPPIRIGCVKSHHLQKGIVEIIVTDSTIQPGDSGGPLFDLSGKLIGLNAVNSTRLKYNCFVAIDVYYRDRVRLEKGETWENQENGVGDMKSLLKIDSSAKGVKLMEKEYKRRIKVGHPPTLAFSKNNPKVTVKDYVDIFNIDTVAISQGSPYYLGKDEPELTSHFTRIKEYKSFLPIPILENKTLVALSCPVSKRHVITKLSLVTKSKGIKGVSRGVGYPVTLVASDETWDLALLDLGKKAKLTPFKWSNEGNNKPGTMIFCPLADLNDIAWGVVSGAAMQITKNRSKNQISIKLSDHRGPYPKVIPCDAAVFPHLCGGPVLNIKGEAIGMTLARKDHATCVMIAAKELKEVITKLLPE
ncbi:serine protease [Verrucomicrobiota bacterium]